jgi:hypothetical protein
MVGVQGGAVSNHGNGILGDDKGLVSGFEAYLGVDQVPIAAGIESTQISHYSSDNKVRDRFHDFKLQWGAQIWYPSEEWRPYAKYMNGNTSYRGLAAQALENGSNNEMELSTKEFGVGFRRRYRHDYKLNTLEKVLTRTISDNCHLFYGWGAEVFGGQSHGNYLNQNGGSRYFGIRLTADLESGPGISIPFVDIHICK